VIDRSARPRLAAKVRLRFDRHEQRHVLVYPDHGMLLSPSAAAIAQLCNGDLTLGQIVEHLHAASSGATREALENDVQAFLAALQERALIKLDT
jgi:pyrroloquinoline quinone biosynthesis protein D